MSRIIWFDGWCNSSVFDESTGIGHIGFTSMSYAHFFSFVWRFLFLIGHMQELLFLYTHKIVPIRHSFAVTYVRLSPEILLFPGFQAFFISIFSHILLDIYSCICYNSHSGGAYYAFKENKNQYRTYLSCDC